VITYSTRRFATPVGACGRLRVPCNRSAHRRVRVHPSSTPLTQTNTIVKNEHRSTLFATSLGARRRSCVPRHLRAHRRARVHRRLLAIVIVGERHQLERRDGDVVPLGARGARAVVLGRDQPVGAAK